MNRIRAVVLGFVVLAVLPFVANDGIVFLVGVALVESMFSLSWNLLFGYTGLATFGHAGFFASGAYLVGYVLKAWPTAPFLPLLLLCALVGGGLAAIVGAIALKRMGGIQLAIVTLAVSEILHLFITRSAALGGADGMSAIPRPVLHLGVATIALDSTKAYFWFLLVVCGGLALALWWFVSSRFGRVLQCIRQDAERAGFLGIDVARHRFVAFVLSGALAAVAGGLFAPWTQIVSPSIASWINSTTPILNSLLGGASFFWGPVLGTFAFALIEWSTRTLAGLSEIVIGLILMVIVLAAPGGILGWVTAAWRRHAGAQSKKRGPTT